MDILKRFLLTISMALTGLKPTVQGLDTVEKSVKRLTKTTVKEIFDKQGVKTGEEIIKTYSNINKVAAKTPSIIEQFSLAMRRALIVAPAWMALRGALLGVFNLIGEQIKFLKDMETAMARIQIVGKGTSEEYDKLKTALITLSIAYGISASAAVEAAQIFAQQGRTIEETFKLTRIAMIASQVLGTDIKTTIDDLTAAVEGFNIPVSDSITIIDKWINVERQFAVTSKDLADATKTAGATAHQLGVSMSEFLGDVTAIIEVTRKTGSQAANALQFIYARVFTTGKKSLEQIAQIPLYLDKAGKATFAISDNYRNLSDVLEELSGKWGSLTEKQKLDIAQNIASKRQLTSFMALMQNYTTSLDARISALASAGASEKAFGIIQETVAVKLERLTASWNGLTAAIADTGAWKIGIDSVNAFLEVLTELVNKNLALEMAGNKAKDAMQKGSDTQKSQLNSLKELIQMRDRYLQRPPTDKNTEMLNKIEDAIKGVESQGKFKLNIFDEKESSKTIDRIDKLIEYINKREISLNVEIDFGVKKQQLENLKNQLKRDIFLDKDLPREKELKQQLIAVENELNNLEKNKTDEINKQISLTEAQNLIKEDASKWAAQETVDTAELTSAEEEKLSIQEKLNFAKSSGVLTSQQLLDLEIGLVSNSGYLYDNHAKTLKLTELESERSSSIVADLNKQLALSEGIAGFLGEQESSIIKQEIAFKSMMYGEDYIRNSAEDRLKLAQALSKEMDDQEKKSSHMVSLAKIAKKYGMGTAQEIAQYQGGAISFGGLSGTAKTALRRMDTGLYEQGQAEEFFAGTGFRFPEQIEKQRKQDRNRQILSSVNIEPINMNVNIEAASIIDSVKEAIVKELDNKKSELAKKINTKIEQF